MITHSHLYIVNAQLTEWNTPQRHILSIRIFTQCPREITLKTLHKTIEERPCTGITESATREIRESIYILPVKLLVLTLEPSHSAGIANNILTCQHLSVILTENTDTTLVGMSTDSIIRYANSHPHYLLFLAATTALHLHNPRLVGITDSKGLTLTTITVFLNKSCHHTNGLTGSLTSLKSNIDK